MSTTSGYTQNGLPFHGSTPGAAHASWTGARAGAVNRKQKTARYIEVVKAAGEAGITDHQAAVRCGLPLPSVNSIRNSLGPLVEDARNPERIERPDERTTQRTRWRWAER